MIEHYKRRLAELQRSYDEAARKRDEIGAALKAGDLTPATAFDLEQKLASLKADVKNIAGQVKAVEEGLTAAVDQERAALEEKLAALKK